MPENNNLRRVAIVISKKVKFPLESLFSLARKADLAYKHSGPGLDPGPLTFTRYSPAGMDPASVGGGGGI